MAELDYAFLADHAQVEGGKLSALGASFTHVRADSPNGLFVLSVAGRVRKAVDEKQPTLSIRLRAPGDAFEMMSDTELNSGMDARPYDDKIGILFAASLAFPIISGLYEVFVELDGVEVRRLAFDLELAG